MLKEYIPYKNTNYFSSLMCDYLEEKEELQSLYNRFPKLENFNNQIDEKSKAYSLETRKLLVDALKGQYADLETSKKTQDNIEVLLKENTFTITTGHQLNLFTGPLYFLYKIISVINLTETLKKEHPENNFVPVYWMATEDHDFDEINYFNFRGQKVRWNREASGAVGRLATEGLDKVFDEFVNALGDGLNATALKDLFKKAYLEHDNLSEATHYLANALFGSYGLVILDADSKELKQVFAPYVKKELLEHTAFKQVNKTNTYLEELNYKIQVNPREINLFYLTDTMRERLVFQDDAFMVYGTEISWSKDEMLHEVNEHPERFSPNAIMRPLYQEVILPNLCYIGGGGELAYWLQLRNYFESVEVPFPMLLLRNSVLLATEKHIEKLKKLDRSISDLFNDQGALISEHTKKLSKINIDLTTQKEHLKQQFKDLYSLAEQTDKSFLGAVGAQERKQTKGLEHLEKRLLKAQKRKFKEEIERLTTLQNTLFPNQSLQERQLNFSELYLEYGDQLIQQLVLNLQPLKGEFLILEP